MAELSKQALKVQNNTEFPNNNAGLITPTKLRGFNVDMIDSLVDEISYQQDSASWNQQIDSLENFTSSVAASVSTASFNSFTQSFNSFSASVTQSIVDLQNFSSSLSGGFVTEGELQAATASLINQINTKLDTSSFNQYTASVTASITNRALLSGSNNFSGSEKFALDGAKGDSFWVSGSDGAPITLSSRYSNRVASIILGAPSNNVLQITSSSDISIEFGGDEKHYGDQIELNGYTPLYRLSDKTPSTSTTYDMKVANKEWSLILASDVNTPTIISATTQSVQINSNLNVTSSLTASIQQGYVWVGNAAGRTSLVPTSSFIDTFNSSSLVTTSSFNSYTQSNDQKVNSLINATGSYATTGSNTFNGNQIINGALYQSGTFYPDQIDWISSSIQLGTGSYILTTDNNGVTQYDNFQNIAAALQPYIQTGSAINTGSFATTGSNTFTGTQTITNDTGNNSFTLTAGGVPVTYGQTALSNFQITQSGSAVMRGNGVGQFDVLATASFNSAAPVIPTINSNVKVNGTFTSSLQQGYVWVGDLNGITTTAATSSFIVNTGSFATTGSNVFIGNETLQDGANNASTLVPVSGSIMLVAKSLTSASSHLTASATNQVNLIFKSNNGTTDTVISGSDNIFSNAGAVVGFRKYIGGAANIYLNTNGVPSVSQSMVFPIVMAGNISTTQAGGITMRGPASSSAWTMNNNIVMGTVNIGSAANTAQNLVSGLTANQNNILGTLNIFANQNNLANGVTFSSTYLNGAATFALSSSAVAVSNGNINDTSFTFTSNYWSGSIGRGNITFASNNIGGVNNTIWVSGSWATGSINVAMSANQMFGGNNTVWVDATGTAYKDFIRNFIAGNQLVVTGSNWLTDTEGHLGSAFIGRYNANDGVRNKTRENVFVVGTGNATTRKTGFLIDSGSNTFVEGTFNVSGSSSYTGSVYGNVVSMSVSSNTASMDLSLGNYFELTSSASPLRINLSNIKSGQTTTLIVSASVSSSITFSSNVGQPSPGGYSGSAAASTDILSFVAFNGSKVNLVATKNIV